MSESNGVALGLPTTEIPTQGATAPEGIEEVASIADPFSLPKTLPEQEVSNDKGGDKDGEKVQGQEGGQEVEPSKEKVSTLGEEDQPQKAETSQTPPTESSSPKVFIAKVGDQEIELKEDATFTFKVDGAEVSPKISDLIQNYKGKIPWDRHYRQLKQDRANFDSDVKKIDAKIREIVTLANADPFKALERMLVHAGKNPAEFIPIYLEQARRTAEQIEGKSDDELRAWMNAKATEYEREKVNLEAAKLKAKEQEIETTNWVTAQQAEHKITDEELDAAWTIANLPENAPLLANKTPMEIAKAVVAYVLEVDRPYTMIEQAVEEVAPDRRHDDRFLRELKDHFKNYPNFTKDDIKEVIAGVVGTKAVPAKSHATDSRAVKEERPNRTNSPETSSKKTAKSAKTLEDFDPVSANDLDELMKLL